MNSLLIMNKIFDRIQVKKMKTSLVKINMSTTINDNGKIERSSFSVMGQAFFKDDGNSLYIKFDEPKTNGEPITKQTIHIQENCITVIRNGAISMNQKFIDRTETEGMFRSPYGSMSMRTKTKHVSFQWDKEKGEGEGSISYTLHLQNENVGQYDLKLTFKEVK